MLMTEKEFMKIQIGDYIKSGTVQGIAINKPDHGIFGLSTTIVYVDHHGKFSKQLIRFNYYPIAEILFKAV